MISAALLVLALLGHCTTKTANLDLVAYLPRTDLSVMSACLTRRIQAGRNTALKRS